MSHDNRRLASVEACITGMPSRFLGSTRCTPSASISGRE
jgi:hypothetical protein